MKVIFFILSLSFGAGAATDTAKNNSSPIWPKDVKIGSDQQITMFQPQVTSLDSNKIKARTAFKIKEGDKDIYGSFALAADSLIAKDQGIVTIENILVTDVQLPQGKTKSADLRGDLQSFFKGKTAQLPYQSLINNHDIQVSAQNRPALQNKAPKFVFTRRPSILIMISGDPVWAPSKGASEVERVSNTSALILRNKIYYIWALGKWFSSPALMGPYSPTKDVTSKITMIKDDLIKSKKVDPLDGQSPDGKSVFSPGDAPLIVLSTAPAELLQSNGEPEFQAVENTGLLYMSNSPNSIFMDSKSQEYFVLVTGRWFKGKTLDGPWDYMAGKDLPADFKKIPVTSPVAEVLVSITGTPQAKEGVIVSSIPQMAQVKKDLKPKNIECDGKKTWQKIESTDLAYAPNCNTPLIKVTSTQFYAVQDGVWFVSSDETSWSVATVVPAQIYKIPPSSPLYYVTYVRIYNVTGDYVTVGYTPGYSGTFVSADGTVVYGTGYIYSSYSSPTTWYPAPATYGYGAGYGWGYESGFYMGFAMGGYMAPWGWGSCCWGGVYVNISVTNVYHNWGSRTVISGPTGRGVTVNSIGNTKFYRQNYTDNIYANHDGQVYRRDGKGDWQRNVGPGTWTPVEKKNSAGLESAHQGRVNGDRQYEGMQNRSGAAEARAGTLHGGSGMRAGGYRGGGGGFRR